MDKNEIKGSLEEHQIFVDESDMSYAVERKGNKICVFEYVNEKIFKRHIFNLDQEVLFLYFNESPPGTDYIVGGCSWVEREQAEKYIERDYAEEREPPESEEEYAERFSIRDKQHALEYVKRDFMPFIMGKGMVDEFFPEKR